MQLSLKRKFGHQHVRAGRFLRVTTTHAASIKTESLIESTGRDPSSGYFAEPGDLAVEIVRARKDESLVGIAYLSGKAVRLMAYDFKPSWFEEAEAARINVPHPNRVPEDEQEEFMTGIIKQFIAVKFTYDVGILDYRLPKGTVDTVAGVANVLMDCYGYEPADKDQNLLPRGHVFGVIHKGKDRSCFHCEPEGQVTENGASIFQINLAVTSRRVKEIEY